MFQIHTQQHTLSLSPTDLSPDLTPQINTTLHHLFINKILQKGVCVAILDILEIKEPWVHPGDGCVWIKVKWRAVILKPFKDEIILGKIAEHHPVKGVRVTLGFFANVWIPKDYLQSGSVFDEQYNEWILYFDGERLFMQLEDEIRLRVQYDILHEPTPTRVKAPPPIKPGAPVASKEEPAPPVVEEIPTYSIICSINEEGLGLTEWWP